MAYRTASLENNCPDCLDEAAEENWTDRLLDTFHVENCTDFWEAVGGCSSRFKEIPENYDGSKWKLVI